LGATTLTPLVAGPLTSACHWKRLRRLVRVLQRASSSSSIAGLRTGCDETAGSDPGLQRVAQNGVGECAVNGDDVRAQEVSLRWGWFGGTERPGGAGPSHPPGRQLEWPAGGSSALVQPSGSASGSTPQTRTPGPAAESTVVPDPAPPGERPAGRLCRRRSRGDGAGAGPARSRTREAYALIGRWITEGHTVASPGAPAVKIQASDIYEWAPGGFFVVHPAYGRIGDAEVGGVEIIGYHEETESYRSHFFDSFGNVSTSRLTVEGDTWTWSGERTRCTSLLSDDGKTFTAHDERSSDGVTWEPSMEVELRRVD
jgi:hypothetical protein